MPTAKKWYQSKTFWFNAVALVVAVIDPFGFAEFSPDPTVLKAGAAIAILAEIGLRFWTKKPITL